MTILWKCDIPVSIVTVLWKLRGRFVKKRSIQTCWFFNKARSIVKITEIIQYWIQTLNIEISQNHNVIIFANECV